MIDANKIQALVNKSIAETDIFLVSVHVGKGNRIAVFVDSVKGLPISECARISRHIESHLDRDTEDFELEVSSPGADRPFVVFEQYEKNLGENVRIVLIDGKTYEGVLQKVENGGIIVTWEEKQKEPGKKKKTTVQHQERILIDDIASAKRLLRF